MRRVKAMAVVAAAVTGAGLMAAAPPASAAVGGTCVWNRICVYYSPNHAGSLTAFDKAYPDLSSPSFKYLGSGAGKGQNVYNNGASGENSHVEYHARVYAKKNYGGYQQAMTPAWSNGYRINFHNTHLRNKNKSLKFSVS